MPTGVTKKRRGRPAQMVHTSKIILRVYPERVDEMNKLVMKRDGLSRNAWILEAIQEKISREFSNRQTA